MNETPRRWYVVHYKSKDDASQGIVYTFGEKAAESAFFPTEQAAYAIKSLMVAGVTFELTDNRKLTIYEFGVEKVNDYKYAIYTEDEIPKNLLVSAHPNENDRELPHPTSSH
jgi:hypothetical protein